MSPLFPMSRVGLPPRWIGLCLVLVFAWSSWAVGQDRVAADYARARELRRKLDETKNEDERDPLQDQFDAAVRALAPTLPAVPVAISEVPAKWTTVALNARGRGFGGLRFTTPEAAGAWDLHWEFVLPRGKGANPPTSWYIMARAGAVRGFKNYEFHNDDKITGLDAPAENLHVNQSLLDGALGPGREYVIWFSFQEDATPAPAWVRLTLVPEGTPRPVPRPPKGDEVRSFGFDGPVLGVAFTPDGRRAVMAVDKVLHVGDVTTGREVAAYDTGHGVWSLAVARPARDTLVATGSGDGNIRLYRLEDGKESAVLSGHVGPVNVLIASRDGRRLLSGGNDRTIRLWDPVSRRELRKFEGHSDEVYGLAFSPDGRRFVSAPGANDGVARVWDAANGQVVARLQGHAGSVYGVAWSRDGGRILTGGADGSLRLWDARTGAEIRRFETTGGDVNSVAFLPDNRRAASAGVDGVVHIWDVDSGRLVRDLKGHTAWIGLRNLTVSPVGGRFLTGGSDKSARLWEFTETPAPKPATGKPR